MLMRHLRRVGGAVVVPPQMVTPWPSLRSGQLAAQAASTSSSPNSSTAASSAATTLDARCAATMVEIEQAGLRKGELVMRGAQGAAVKIEGRGRTDEMINFCANNYLGLANHPAVVKAAQKALDDFGFGMASVRFICGTQTQHKRLEATIARFHGTDDSILFPSCFDANALFEAIVGPGDFVISDALNHASIIDGIRLCKAHRLRYEHNSPAALRLQLEAARETAATEGREWDSCVKLVVTDGVFSMDGDFAPLPEIRALCDEFGAQLMVDECHATGVMGETGRGTPELTGARADMISSTLGKALGGGTGGYVAASQQVVDLLRQRARPYLFSNSVAPPVVGASQEVFQLLQADEGKALLARLRENVGYVRERLGGAGFNVLGDDRAAIVPVLFGDARLAADMAAAVRARGIYCVAFSYPVVPKGSARIRLQLSAAHDKAQLQKLIGAFVGAAKEVGEIELVGGAARDQKREEIDVRQGRARM